jgi:hypothetical protein
MIAAFALAGILWSAGSARRAFAQEVVGVTAIESADEASLIFELVGDESLAISLSGGTLAIGGSPIATLPSTSVFEAQWRDLVSQSSHLPIGDLAQQLAGFDIAEATDAERASLEAVRAALQSLAAVDAVSPDVPIARPEIVMVRPTERVRAVIPSADAAVATRPAPIADVHGSTSLVGGIAGGVMNLLASYIALAFMGLGLLFFAPKQLETVADTVWHSFGRSFLAGLFAQPLILPVFAMMIVGLALTVVGIVVVPFAVSAFLAALLLGILGGFIAVARTVGEIYLRRRMARGEAVRTWGSYRYVVYGLLGLLAIWLPAALLGWVPVAGTLLTVTAGVATWVLATAGFGAAIISRGGVRGTFVRQIDLALTDEQFWTEDAMPTPPVSRELRRSR